MWLLKIVRLLGGLSAVHQFVRIGELAIIGGCSKVVQDISPFMMTDGHPVRAFGLNSIGLDRAGASKEEKAVLKKAFKIVFRSKMTLKNACKEIEDTIESTPSIQKLLTFLKKSERGICK